MIQQQTTKTIVRDDKKNKDKSQFDKNKLTESFHIHLIMLQITISISKINYSPDDLSFQHASSQAPIIWSITISTHTTSKPFQPLSLSFHACFFSHDMIHKL